jgi:hypothetical protein
MDWNAESSHYNLGVQNVTFQAIVVVVVCFLVSISKIISVFASPNNVSLLTRCYT